jgi:hypothetical protein
LQLNSFDRKGWVIFSTGNSNLQVTFPLTQNITVIAKSYRPTFFSSPLHLWHTYCSIGICGVRIRDPRRCFMADEKRDIWSNHFLWMILCCAIPLAGIVLLSFFGVLGAWGLYALILLCPLLHFVFMRIMAHKEMPKGSSKNSVIGE